MGHELGREHQVGSLNNIFNYNYYFFTELNEFSKIHLGKSQISPGDGSENRKHCVKMKFTQIQTF